MGLRSALANALVEKTRQDAAKLDQRLNSGEPLTKREKRQARRTIANVERVIDATAGSSSEEEVRLARLGVVSLKERLDNNLQQVAPTSNLLWFITGKVAGVARRSGPCYLTVRSPTM